MLASQVAIYFIAILGLNILTGYTGQISIGHGAFMAIGGYTTAVMSHDHHTNLDRDAADRVRDRLRLRRRSSALPALALLGRLPRPRDVRARRLGAAVRPEVLEVPRGAQRHLQTSTDRLPRWLYVVSWTCAAILFVARLAPAARADRARVPRGARQRGRRRVVRRSSLPIYKTLAFGVSAAFAGVAGSLFVLATNGYAQPDEFGVLLSLQILIGAAVAGLGSLWGVLVGAVFVGLLPEHLVERAADRLEPRPGRRLRPRSSIVVMLLLPNGVAGLLLRLGRLRARA